MTSARLSSRGNPCGSTSGSPKPLPDWLRYTRVPSRCRYTRSAMPEPSTSASRTRRWSKWSGSSSHGMPSMVTLAPNVPNPVLGQ